MSSNKIKSFNQNRDLCFWSMIWGWIPSVWRAVLSLFYPPVIIWGKNGKNSENPVGSNKSEKRKPKSAVYRRILASVVYFHLRIISAKNHKRKMTRNQFGSNPTRVRIPPAAPARRKRHIACDELFHFITKLIARSFCCSPLPNRTRFAGLRFGSAAARRVFLIAKNIDFNCPYKLKQAIYDLLRLIL